MTGNMGTQYSFRLEDTNRDGAPVPDVFVTASGPLSAAEFLDYLVAKSNHFASVFNNKRSEYGTYRHENGYKAGKEEVYKALVAYYYEEGEPTALRLLLEAWEVPLTRKFTVKVHFDAIEEPCVIYGVEAEDEEEAERIVQEGFQECEIVINYNGPGDLEDDPGGQMYIDNVEVDEELD
jgi:hypothetical protein